MAKRTKQVEQMVEVINELLKNNRVRDEYSSDIFWTMQYLLLQTKTYKGYNYFYYKPYTDVVGNETLIPVLAGTSDKEELQKLDAFVQFY